MWKKNSKTLFYQNMQPYFDKKLVREIYNSDQLCILSVGERVYVACPYMLLKKSPFGIYMNENAMKIIVENNDKFYHIIDEVFSDFQGNKELVFLFSNEKIEFWEKWIKENSKVNQMDYDLESEINRINESKRK